MNYSDAAFLVCIVAGAGAAVAHGLRWYAGRHDRRRVKAEAARNELDAIATGVLWREANEQRAKARAEWDAARERRDTRGEGMAALTAKANTTRALKLELGR
jgi:hypothetical protein